MQGEIERVGVPTGSSRSSRGERVIVGVNALRRTSGGSAIELQPIDPAAERRQLERTARVRAERNADEAAAALAARARGGARRRTNLLPPMRDALRARCTIGEICGVLRDGVGRARPSPSAAS